MKKLLHIVLLVINGIAPAFPQNKSTPATDLTISWINDDSGNAALKLENTGKTDLSPAGWRLFFNSGGFKLSDSAAVALRHVNGDLFSLVPKELFKGIKAGNTFLLPIKPDMINNITDYPKGFYLVYDQSPAKGYNLAPLDIAPLSGTETAEQMLNTKIYQQNSLVENLNVSSLPAIFPTPASYTAGAGSFNLNKLTSIVADPLFANEANILAEDIFRVTGKKPAITRKKVAGAIVLTNSNLDKGEAYKLTVTPENITISAGSSAGIFYGIQSLKTCIPAKAWASENLTITVPAMQVSDSPRFPHRAVMLDVGRNFRPKQEVLKVLDLMALYKLNVLHFHLTEDEGWRIEIPSLPELTSVGGRRGHTLTETDMLVPSYGSGADASNTNGSGYYTKAEFINILKYAKARHIRVIPEIETPGHARAAIRAMDARYQKYMREGRQKEAEEFLLHDLKDRSVYRSVQGWNDNVINVALPSVYRFMEKVTDEILEMYNIAGAPIQTIHFGGDEVPPGVWTASPAVDSLKKQDPSVKNTDDLWRYYFSKINTMVSARNLYLSGWEEIGLTKTELNGRRQFIPEKAFAGNNFHTDVWNNIFGAEGLAYELANAGYKVLLTMVTNFYFDLAANKSYYEPGQYWGGYVDVDKPFYFIPYDYYKNQKEDTRGNPINKAVFEGKARLTNGGRANITGLQAPVWSEIIKSDELLEYMLLPKLFGLAERAWAKDPAWATEIDSSKSAQQYNRAWSEFINVLGKKELPRLDHYSGGYNYRIPTPGIAMENGKLSANILYPGMVIRYTTDGSEPGKDSQLYSIPLPANGRVKLKAFNSAGRGGRSVQYIAD